MSARRRVFTVGVAALACMGLLPAIAQAQGTTAGAVAGVVRDTTGAVLPGVTAEAASPALIEKVRSAVTNEQGQFQIVDLPPGAYTVAFTLPGFRTLRREGIDLSAGFTATVNAEMTVGGVEETLTVTGETPLVDTHATNAKTTFTRETMDAMPVAKYFAAMAVLIPGVQILASSANSQGATQDVGGTMGERNNALMFHGSAGGDMPQNLDGMRPGRGFGQGNVWVANNGIVQETVIDTSGFSAETESSGLSVNFITRSGGNRFSGSLFTAYTNNNLQATNLNDVLVSRGSTDSYRISKIWDVNPSVGGPIKRDKLWFFYSYRNWGTKDHNPNAYFSKNPTGFAYQPDPANPAISPTVVEANNLRLTWQVSENHKLGFYADNIRRCSCLREAGSVLAPEATQNSATPNNYFGLLTWTWTASNRLLVEANQSLRREEFTWYQYASLNQYPNTHYADLFPNSQGALDGIQVVDGGLGVTYRALGPQNAFSSSHLAPGKATVSYVTGAHNLKVGAQWNGGATFAVEANKIFSDSNVQYAYSFTNGVPQSVTFVAPAQTGNNVKLALGLFAQDRWTVNRLTVNAGLRFDYQNGYLPAHHFPATTYAPVRDFPQVDCLPCWKDIEPRFGISYDLFGNGKTALKANAGRFVEALSLGSSIPSAVDPGSANAVTRTTRAWTDRNGDFVPQEEELGPSTNNNFGTANVGIAYDPALISGFQNRAWNWEWSTGVQHELIPGLSADVGYYHRARGKFRLTQNVALTTANFDPYCVTAPVDSRLPNGGGYSVCGLWNVQQTSVGVNNNIITSADNFGGVTEHFDSLDVNVAARLRQVTFQGGTSTGRVTDNICNLAANPTLSTLSTNLYGGGNFGTVFPNDPAYCDSHPPFLTFVKMLGIVPLPWWGIQTSASYQSIPGNPILANWSAPVAAVTGLNRPISGGARNVTVPLVPYGTLYNERVNQVDFRVSKTFTVQRVRVQGQFDLYNVFNKATATQQNNTFSPSNQNWQTPSVIMGGRLAKFGVMITF